MRWRLLLVPVAILTSDAFEASAASTPLTTAATPVTGDRCINGELLDPSALLIAKGYAFATLNAEWLPIRISYAMVEQWVRARKAPLCQFSDVAHPAWVLSRGVTQHEGR